MEFWAVALARQLDDISDFRDPHLDTSYEARVDLLGRGAAVIRGALDLREGVADFKGSGQWSLNDFSTAGASPCASPALAGPIRSQSRRSSGVSDYSSATSRSSCRNCRENCLAEVLRAMPKWTTGCIAFRRQSGKGKKGCEECCRAYRARPAAEKGGKTEGLPGVRERQQCICVCGMSRQRRLRPSLEICQPILSGDFILPVRPADSRCLLEAALPRMRRSRDSLSM